MTCIAECFLNLGLKVARIGWMSWSDCTLDMTPPSPVVMGLYLWLISISDGVQCLGTPGMLEMPLWGRLRCSWIYLTFPFDSCFRAENRTWKWSLFLEGLSREHLWGLGAERCPEEHTNSQMNLFDRVTGGTSFKLCAHISLFGACSVSSHSPQCSLFLLCPSGPSERFQLSSLADWWPVRTPLHPHSLDFLILKGTQSPGKHMGDLVITISFLHWI